MARVLVTGSSDGLGHDAARLLLDEGHDVVVHVRSPQRQDAVRSLVDRGAAVVVGDLRDLDATRDVAAQVDRLGRMDAVIHNAGTMSDADALAVNVVAPYVLTALVERPDRLVYLSSGMHTGGRARLDGLDRPGGRPSIGYSDSKLLVTMLALAVARLWPDVTSNAVDPGWVPTRMGGAGAPDDRHLGALTQVWLAVDDDPRARTTGAYWYHQQQRRTHPAAGDPQLQGRLLAALEARTGVAMPTG